MLDTKLYNKIKFFKLKKDNFLKRYIIFDNLIHNKSIRNEYLSLLSRVIPKNI